MDEYGGLTHAGYAFWCTWCNWSGEVWLKRELPAECPNHPGWGLRYFKGTANIPDVYSIAEGQARGMGILFYEKLPDWLLNKARGIQAEDKAIIKAFSGGASHELSPSA